MGAYDDSVARAAVPVAQKAATAVSNLAPYNTVFTTQDNLGSTAAQKLPTPPTTGGTFLDKLGSFVGSFASETGNIIGGAAQFLGNAALEAVEAPFKLVGNISNEIQLNNTNDSNQKQLNMLSTQLNQLSADYRAGKITRDQYLKSLTATNDDWDKLNKSVNQTLAALNQNATDTTQSFIGTAEDVLAVVTAGASKGITALAVDGAKAVGDGSSAAVINFFGKREVSDVMYGAATKIDTVVQKAVDAGNVATTLNGKLPAGVIAKITHETLTSGAPNLTARQIGQNVAINIVLKKPLIYQTNIDLATNIYKDMQKGDLSGAALSTVLTASMALSGGPIGYALESAGKGLGWLRAATFSGGNVAKLLKEENETNIRNGNAALVTKEIIDTNAKTSVSQQSFIDSLSTHIGEGKASQMYDELIKRTQAGDTESYKAIKILEETNMKMASGNSVNAAQLIADHYNGLDGGKWLRSATAAQVIDDMVNWSAAREAVVQNAIKNGMSAADAARIVVGRTNHSDLELISDIVRKADETLGSPMGADGHMDYEAFQNLINARKELLQQAINRYGRTASWANSNTLITQIRSILTNNHDPEEMVKQIEQIKTGNAIGKGVDQEVKDQLSKHGYIAVLPEKTHTPYIQYKDTKGGLKSAYAPKTGNESDNPILDLPVRDSEAQAAAAGVPKASSATIFEHAVTPVPVFAAVGNLLTRLGLSPEASQEAVQKYFQANFDSLIRKSTADISGQVKTMGSEDILSQLYAHVRDTNATQRIHAPVVDLRQMTKNEVKAALGANDQEAKAVMSSLNSAMLQVPLAARGLGDKVQDINTAFNPLAAKFSRAQGAARFVWNPFFRWQQTYQTEGLAQLEAGGKIVELPFLNGVNRVLFGDTMRQNAETVTMLEDRNIFGAGFSGVGATGDVSGQIGTRIIKSEKISLAGLVNKQASLLGMTPTEFVDTNQSAVVDTLRMITTNNHTQGFLDSPLARTINTAFFPFRYNLKVANLMAGYIGKLSAPTQVALVGSMMNAQSWLKSDEGIAWQQQHSDAIGLFNWLSPTYPLAYVMKLGQDIADPQDSSIGDLGLLGGLPFGMISQFLESSGVINTSAPYLNPKTGDVYPNYVPNSARGAVNLAIQDFIGSLFSYPGAIVGLPGKGTEIRGLVNNTFGGGKDFTQVDQSANLTPNQRHEQQILQENATTAPKATSPTDSLTLPDNTITTTAKPALSAAPRASASNSGTKKKKKSDYRPTPLP